MLFLGLYRFRLTIVCGAMSKPTEHAARPTLRTLAHITGLGISTVSQALRDNPEIAEDTKRRVKLAAQQAGYRPDRAGVRLRTGKTNVITLVLNPEDEGGGFFSQFVYGVSDGLKGTPYHLVITPYDLNDPMLPVRYIVETSSADGVILSRTQPIDSRVRYLADNNMPFVTHGRTDMGLVHPYHDFDNDGFAYEAVKQLAARGRKRIALLGPPPELNYTLHTNQGFERAINDFGLEAFALNSCHTDLPLAQIKDVGRSLAHLPHRPDGIVGSATTAAFAISAGMQQEGLRIGVDFDTASKQSSKLLSIAIPEIISIPEDFREAGKELVSLLIRAINGEPVETLNSLQKPT
jgi:LacI family transcriptional regulator